MQIIIISPKNTTHQHWHLSPAMLQSMAVLALMMILSISYSAYKLFDLAPQTAPLLNPITAVATKTDDAEKSQREAYYAKRIGTLQAEAIRLKALTTKLANMSGLDLTISELDNAPGQGGLAFQEGEVLTAEDFESYFSELEGNFGSQSAELKQLQDYLITRDNIKSAIPSGRPIKDGWLSSYYGNRVDPFNGKKVFHRGLDFAGKAGSEVVSVADGIVSWHGTRGGYGEMIEVNHGNGYQTRYAHNKKLVVKLGDRIKKGQAIALMGSTGRSTGPHVHFEVLRDGKTVNPYNFIKH
jgi:murein DD-endopeptidase MepM/ murein hydrolase activator NlpD